MRKAEAGKCKRQRGEKEGAQHVSGSPKPKKVLTARERQRARVRIHWKFEHVE
jgi:hypothetical protein